MKSEGGFCNKESFFQARKTMPGASIFTAFLFLALPFLRASFAKPCSPPRDIGEHTYLRNRANRKAPKDSSTAHPRDKGFCILPLCLFYFQETN